MGLNEIISFELAKLLVENNFYGRTIPYYVKGVLWNNQIGKLGSHSDCSSNPSSLVEYKDVTPAPTIAHVIDWLFDEHELWIQIPYSYNDPKPFCWTIVKTNEIESDKNCWLSGVDNDDDGYISPYEASEAAINYCLTNLLNNQIL